MSYQGDVSFARSLRDKLIEAIESEKEQLVDITSDRRAGHIQGLRDALLTLNELLRQWTGDPTPKDGNG